MDPFRGATAIAGIGQTPYWKRGTAGEPEMKLCLRAIVAACEDAGVSPADVDGFVSYGSDRNEGQKLMQALGTKELRFNVLNWAHGGGIPGAVAVAAGAVISGQAEIVAVYRAMAERSGRRLRVAVNMDDRSPHYIVNGLDSPAQTCALRTQRMIETDGVPRSAMMAMAIAAYHHAQNNPNAQGRGTLLDQEMYESSRWISEPLRLFDCSRENDAGVAVLVMSAERARSQQQTPAYVLSCPMGAAQGWGPLLENHAAYTSAGFRTIAKRLWAQSGYGPDDVDVVQVYENFTGPGVGALLDHGFCTMENIGDVLRFENLIAPSGSLPVNTSGGNLAEGFIHGMGLVTESVRQIRGTSTNQVPGAALSLMTGGPQDHTVSSMLLGSEETLR